MATWEKTLSDLRGARFRRFERCPAQRSHACFGSSTSERHSPTPVAYADGTLAVEMDPIPPMVSSLAACNPCAPPVIGQSGRQPLELAVIERT